jgi:predicted secreted hydrolase
MPFFKPALPGYRYSFPKDHAAHEEYRTEWWYYTGHLQSADGRTYGYQLTFFRSGMDHPSLAANPSRWAIQHLYLAHFAVTDENEKRFFYTDKVNRAGIGNAGADAASYHIWNGSWTVSTVRSVHHLTASENEWAVDLMLAPRKPPVIHGRDGISKKGEGPTQSSHYYSLTDMETRGTIKADGHTLKVKGTSWMDHEFGSNQLSEDQAGWDWFGLQLDSGIELMLYQIRRNDGRLETSTCGDPCGAPSGHPPMPPHPSPSPAKPNDVLSFSSGTVVLENGESKHLGLSDFQIKAKGVWKSAQSGGSYPSHWEISIPNQAMTLTLTPTVSDQELITTRSTGVTYWEGSVIIQGTYKERPITGKGYVELTGYAQSLRKKF